MFKKLFSSAVLFLLSTPSRFSALFGLPITSAFTVLSRLKIFSVFTTLFRLTTSFAFTALFRQKTTAAFTTLFALTTVFISSLVLATTVFAGEYRIIVDAGSTGSRVHLFKYNQDKNMPEIIEVFNKKNSTPLASFAATPDQAGFSLKPILEDTIKYIEAQDIKELIPISVLGTAGMRLLTTDEQTEIYRYVKKVIETHYSKNLLASDVKTISGQEEALYDWLDVNYVAKNFQNHSDTAGAIDMGGASTQIAFAVDNTQTPNDVTVIKINNQSYRVFAKSFLGLGQDLASNSMKTNPNASSCFPNEAPYEQGLATKAAFMSSSLGAFELLSCQGIYNQVIEQHQVAQQLGSFTKPATFMAFSGAYYTYHFFDVDNNLPDKVSMINNVINPVCAKNNWEDLKKLYPTEDEKYLINYCSSVVYFNTLFFDHYKLNHTQLKIVSKINNQSIDWTLGAMLYQLVQ